MSQLTWSEDVFATFRLAACDFTLLFGLKSIVFSLALLARRSLLEAIGGSSPESSMSQNTSIGDLCVSYDRLKRP